MELDVEAKNRLDTLSHELLKNGVAASRSDAEKRAMEILGIDINKKSAEKEDDKMREEFSKIIEDNNAKIMREFILVKQKMDEMIKEINKLNGELSGLKNEVKKEPVIIKRKVEAREEQGIEKQETAEQKPEPAKEIIMNEPASHTQAALNESRGSFDQGAKSDHPRSGGYGPKDVAIEKMFYFGKK
ncbi:MAG TPA: hypothetical protein VI894_00510 [Candidatus Nanoarchaeia archaeon]|nr:hypothetical protein [Candidatus Nanoarchaeia archaeon]